MKKTKAPAKKAAPAKSAKAVKAISKPARTPEQHQHHVTKLSILFAIVATLIFVCAQQFYFGG